MICYDSILKYREQFPDDCCCFSEPGSGVLISTKSGDTFISPVQEDDKAFSERLERCKDEQRNLFYEEWELYHCEKGIMY